MIWIRKQGFLWDLENFTLGHFICLYVEQSGFRETGLGGNYLGWEATAETYRMHWKTGAEKEQEKTTSKGKMKRLALERKKQYFFF